MAAAEVKKQIINELNTLPHKYIIEVYDFIEFLKLREDQWFINFVNQRTRAALKAKKEGKHFSSLKELQKEFR
ncbi:hypothetical protein A2625_05815 [candidate division WOR-1 bacterium RIFCSPHIGHO2_01_FULL_53_15]|uniref:DUF2281 domain-containing protein n=1 Tax=candidate division WOR-1 bacterium RIFCSPHIGHO2_01_FULL_53_15 TaxID=1802564 RepID=A0A1F4Q317_UNCSA|nr:MAG: hypothetical protein A2625_05815 [candidate division WOR-1 bacterium RIFCSPHIGHO2_01_FULL_53_15]OGC13888.1 MAG: hypothetical protein A3D23_02405 [candidate division WOR-1 bacterium RIFCSPHIGHO2_02_FULL_53_26]